jgi:hypothetical protein
MNLGTILAWFAKTIAGLIFILSLSLFIITLSFVEFSSYNNLKPMVADLLSSQLSEQIDQNYIIQIRSLLVSQCAITNNETIEFRFAGENNRFRCSDIKASTPENFTELVIDNVFNSIYYKKYDCELIKCLEQPGEDKLFILISAKANEFLKNIQTYLLATSIISACIVLLLNRTWSARLKEMGILMIFVGLPAVMLKPMEKSLETSLIPSEALTLVEPVINKLFMIISSKFMIVLIVGTGLTLVGFGLWVYEKLKRPRKVEIKR